MYTANYLNRKVKGVIKKGSLRKGLTREENKHVNDFFFSVTRKLLQYCHIHVIPTRPALCVPELNCCL